MYSSKTLTDRNNDPKPHRYPNTYDALTGAGDLRSRQGNGNLTVLDPRPEFQHGKLPANPILVEFRETRRRTGYKFLAEAWLDLLEEDPEMSEAFVWHPILNPTESEIRHAHRVLTLLANLNTKEN